MKTKLTLAILMCMVCFFAAAAMAQAATLAGSVSTLKIKPDQVFVVGDDALLSLSTVSAAGMINFSANITLISGSTDVQSINFGGKTETCTGFTCNNHTLWPFHINALPVKYSVKLTDIDTGATYTINASTDQDSDDDGYDSKEYSGGTDCNDNDVSIHPGAADNTADGIDNDCDGSTDEDYVAPSGGSSSTSGGGSHRGGRTSGALTTANFDCMKGNVTVGKNDKIVVSYKKTNYTFFINDILASTMQVKLYPIPSRDYAIDEGKGKEIDLDRNNRNDFILNVLDIKNGKASITCRTTSEIGATVEPKKEEPKEEEEETPVMQNIKEGVINIASQVIPKEKASPVIGSLVALAIIVGGLLIYYLTRRGEADEVAY